VFRITPDGALTTLHVFCSQTACADGAQPLGALIEGSDGNFYGTTFEGGIQDYNCSQADYFGCGTVFRITPEGALTTLYSFCPQGDPCYDGDSPIGGLIQDADGILYGTTSEGGDPSSASAQQGAALSLA